MVTKIKELKAPEIEQPNNEGVSSYKELQEFQTIRNILPLEYILLDTAPAVPEKILLGSLRDGRLRVNSPLKVKFTREDRHYIAEAEELNEFGFGENPSEALHDLQRTIAELYFTLDSERDRLSSDLRSVWENLQQKITKR